MEASPVGRRPPPAGPAGRPHTTSFLLSFMDILCSVHFLFSALPVFDIALPFIAYDMIVRLRQILNYWHVSLMSSSIQFIYSLYVSVSSFPFSVFFHACMHSSVAIFCILAFLL